MADHYLIESRWSGNILTTNSDASTSFAVAGNVYDTKNPDQIKQRGMPKKDAGRPSIVRQGESLKKSMFCFVFFFF
jgi:hypothetical protein